MRISPHPVLLYLFSGVEWLCFLTFLPYLNTDYAKRALILSSINKGLSLFIKQDHLLHLVHNAESHTALIFYSDWCAQHHKTETSIRKSIFINRSREVTYKMWILLTFYSILILFMLTKLQHADEDKTTDLIFSQDTTAAVKDRNNKQTSRRCESLSSHEMINTKGGRGKHFPESSGL